MNPALWVQLNVFMLAVGAVLAVGASERRLNGEERASGSESCLIGIGRWRIAITGVN